MRMGECEAEEEDEVGKVGARSAVPQLQRNHTHFSHSRVFGKPHHIDLRPSEFPKATWWAITWASAQLQPISSTFRRNLLLHTEYSPTPAQYH